MPRRGKNEIQYRGGSAAETERRETAVKTKERTAPGAALGRRISRWADAWRRLLETRPIPALAVLSALLELIIELLGHKPFYTAFLFIGHSPHMFLLNAAIIFSTLMFVMVLRRKV